jgi:hypothetical protein
LASFESHIYQAKRNLNFLVSINESQRDYWDWQVTVCFYVNVHLVNAHLARVGELHYRTHEDVKNAINPFNALAIGRVSEDIYLAYAKLEGLSRRSRYLCHDDPKVKETGTYPTYDKHFAKAVKQLDKLLFYFSELYTLDFGNPAVSCLDLSTRTPLAVFKVKE